MQSPDSVDGDNGNGPAFEYRAVTIEQTGDPREMLEVRRPLILCPAVRSMLYCPRTMLSLYPLPLPLLHRCVPFTRVPGILVTTCRRPSIPRG